MGQALTHEKLQSALSSYLLRKMLRPAGIGSIIFGVLAIGMGGTGMNQNPLNAVLDVIGVFLLAEGICALAVPSPGVVIADGVALICVGLWNLLIGFAESGSGFFIYLGIMQLIWGAKRFGLYSRFSRASRERPSMEATQWITELMTEVPAADPGRPDVLEFRAKPPWKGKFLGDMALFVMGKGQDALLVDKREVELDATDNRLDGKPLKAILHIGARTIKGTVSSEGMRRFTTWKMVGA